MHVYLSDEMIIHDVQPNGFLRIMDRFILNNKVKLSIFIRAQVYSLGPT